MSDDQSGTGSTPDPHATPASSGTTPGETASGAAAPDQRPRPAYGEYAPTPVGGGETDATGAQAPPAAPHDSPAPPRGGVVPPAATRPSATDGTPGPRGTGAFAGGGQPQTLATFTRYEDAQSAVDLLSDEGFPVESVSIVGHDIRTVENVTGRLTKGGAAARGAGGGAWFGLFLGLLFGLFATNVAFIGILLIAVGGGALWGALWGFVGHAALRGRRDFASTKTMEAGSYEVLVRGELAVQAHQVLARGRGIAP
ncbi:general stress protein [Frigoribacterium sp. Leaf263]|uniref:general stress protein n=1 Tax=Frigoribacterium sp. Leaf263 TaxID=1736313 RepID=UPI000AE9F86A|nr:general stress protein [Frigoribacterium sp. Leaf263]